MHLHRTFESKSRPDIRQRLRRILSTTLILFLCSMECSKATPIPLGSIVFQSDTSLNDLYNIPDDLAWVESHYQGNSSQKTVFLLQDAHTNESGQINLAKTLDHILQSEKDIQYVFSEAGEGDLSLSFLKSTIDLSIRKRVLMSYLRKGLVKGTEYLNAVGEHEFVLWGIEKQHLYQQAITLYRKNARSRTQSLRYLRKIKSSLNALKPRIYSSDLRQWDQIVQQFLKKEMNLEYYLTSLIQFAEKSNIPMSLFPNIMSLVNSPNESQPQDSIDQNHIQTILTSIKMLESMIYHRLSDTSDAKHLIRYSQSINTLIKLAQLQLTPDEFQSISQHPELFDIKTITGFINKKIMDLERYHEKAIFLENSISQALRNALSFYKLTHRRDQHMIQSMLQKMTEQQHHKAVLVTGGFHASNLKSLLEQNNISYISIIPHVVHETNLQRYETLLLKQSREVVQKISAPNTDNLMLSHVLSDKEITFNILRAMNAPKETYAIAASRLSSDKHVREEPGPLESIVLSAASAEQIAYKNYFTKGVFEPENTILSSILGERQVTIFLDEAIYDEYTPKIKAYMKVHGIANYSIYLGKTSEHHKQMEEVLEILDNAVKDRRDRKAIFLVVGGGTLMDVVGLAAQLYRRGIDYVRVPTTLLGIVDAAIGVKVGVNYRDRKNLVGSFYAPYAVVSDTSFIETQEPRQLSSGLAEMLKMAIVSDPELFDNLENHGRQIRDGESFPEKDDIIRSAALGELRQIQKDFYESDLRREVDFGHTFAHYIEQVSKYDLLHGEAVALDILITSHISMTRGILDAESFERIVNVVRELELPLFHPSLTLPNMMIGVQNAIAHKGGELIMVIPSNIGEVMFAGEISEAELGQALDALSSLSKETRDGSRMAKQFSANPIITEPEEAQSKRTYLATSNPDVAQVISFIAGVDRELGIKHGSQLILDNILLQLEHDSVNAYKLIVKGLWEEEGSVFLGGPNHGLSKRSNTANNSLLKQPKTNSIMHIIGSNRHRHSISYSA